MSESSGGSAPPPATGQPAAGGDVKPAAVTPLGSSPALQGGISLDDAIKQVGETRQRRARPSRQPAHPAASPQPSPPSPSNGAAAPNGTAAPTADPIDGLIRAYRERNAPPAAANGAEPPSPTPHSNGQAPPAAAAEGYSGPVRLTIDGRTGDFTPEQLTTALRQAHDYTNKTKQLADFTRQVNERAEAINRMMPVLVPEIERQIGILDAQLGKQPDWRKLAETDPAEYQRQDAAWKEAAAERQRLDALMQVQQQETEQTRQARLAEGHAQLVKALPGWDDAGQRGKLQSEMIRWGRAQGFPEAELNSLYEPRHVIALFKAMAFDRMMHGVRSDAPIVPQAQNGRALPPTQQVGQAQEEFSRRPTMRNAVSLLNARRRVQH